MTRVVVIGLLTLMCLDLAMDLAHGENGDFAHDNQATAWVNPTVGSPAISSDTTTKSETSGADHECFCCCSHLLVKPAAILSVVLDSVPGFTNGNVFMPDPDPVHVYHPPLYAL